MDVISIYSSGIKNVVSNSGTALTENQINLIWKFFSDPIVCLDGDSSGQRAALRIAESLLPFIKENNKISTKATDVIELRRFFFSSSFRTKTPYESEPLAFLFLMSYFFKERSEILTKEIRNQEKK